MYKATIEIVGDFEYVPLIFETEKDAYQYLWKHYGEWFRNAKHMRRYCGVEKCVQFERPAWFDLNPYVVTFEEDSAKPTSISKRFDDDMLKHREIVVHLQYGSLLKFWSRKSKTKALIEAAELYKKLTHVQI